MAINHFQVIDDNFYSGLLNQLRRIVPEFTSVFDVKDGVYPVLGEFGRFILDESENSKNLIQRCFSFIQKALDEGGSKTREAIKSEILEQLVSHSRMVDLAEFHLKGKALEIFNAELDSYRSTNS